MPCRDARDVGGDGDMGQARPVRRGARLARVSGSRSGAAVKGGRDAAINGRNVATLARSRALGFGKDLEASRPAKRTLDGRAATPRCGRGWCPAVVGAGLAFGGPGAVHRVTRGRHPCPSGERSSPTPGPPGGCHPAARAAAIPALMRRNSSRRSAWTRRAASRSVSAAAAASSRAKPRPGLSDSSAPGIERSRA